jgi:ribosomal protein S18 acetylase RimI-like enzyme
MAAVALRPIADDDRELLYRIYASTRTAEMEMVDWSAAQKDAFLRMQFSAQHSYYLENYRSAEFLVIEVEGRPAGRLYVSRLPEEIRIVDISLLPEARGHGLGTGVVGRLLDEGRASGKPVRIHVEHLNPALRLYERLGFKVIADRGVYLFLEWRPAEAA